MSNLLNKEVFSRLGKNLENNYRTASKVKKIIFFSGFGLAALVVLSVNGFQNPRKYSEAIKKIPAFVNTCLI